MNIRNVLRVLDLCVCIQFIIDLSYIVRETSKHMRRSECPVHTLPQDSVSVATLLCSIVEKLDKELIYY